MGFYYAIESLSWSSLIAEDHEEGALVCLYYCIHEREAKRKKWEEEICNITEQKKPQLWTKYHVFPPGFDDPDEHCLIAYPLQDVLNINTISQHFDATLEETIRILIDLMNSTKDLLIPPPR